MGMPLQNRLLAWVVFSGMVAVLPSHSAATACDPNARSPVVECAQDAGSAIRTATGLRFRVAESIVRRNIISTRTPYGFKVKSVDANSAAALAGLKPGDVLLEWDGQPIKSLGALAKWIDGADHDREISIKFARLKEKRRLLDRHPWVEHESTLALDR